MNNLQKVTLEPGSKCHLIYVNLDDSFISGEKLSSFIVFFRIWGYNLYVGKSMKKRASGDGKTEVNQKN